QKPAFAAKSSQAQSAYQKRDAGDHARSVSGRVGESCRDAIMVDAVEGDVRAFVNDRVHGVEWIEARHAPDNFREGNQQNRQIEPSDTSRQAPHRIFVKQAAEQNKGTNSTLP